MTSRGFAQEALAGLELSEFIRLSDKNFIKDKKYYLDLRKKGWMGDIENDLLIRRVSLV